MKRWIYNIGYLLLAMSVFFLSACSDEVIPPDPSGDDVIPGSGDKEIPLMISLEDLFLSGPTTYSTDYSGETSVGGSAWENAINDITVYIFNQSFECEKIVTASSSPTNPVMVKTGNKNFVVVVNAAGKLTLPATEAATDYTSLLKMITDASASLPTSPFLMTGKLFNVPLPDELPSASPYNITIDVERACAKVTLQVTKSGLSASHNITLQKITLHKGADRVALFETPSSNPTIYSLFQSETVFNPVSGTVPNKGSGYCFLDTAFYTYESLCGADTTKAVWIEIESAVNSPTNVRKAKFYLAEHIPAPGDTVYNVKRNYWYNVTVDIVKPGMDSIYVTVNACPWNVTDTMTVSPGEGGVFTTAVPFKLVKNYTAAELTGTNESFAAIDQHTKGASWIDLMVTDKTEWELILKDATPRNTGVIGSVDGGTTWTSFPLSGKGGDTIQRVYVYRPYRENNEPDLGPSFYVTLGGQYKQDFIIQPRDTTPIPTNCYIMRPKLSGTPVNETRAYIPLAGVYKYWEDYIYENGIAIPDGPVTAELIWKDTHPGDVVNTSTLKVINANKRDSAYIYAEAGSTEGNAIVAMKINGVIYWSFHLWVTEYNPYEAAGQKLYETTNNVFMDRNLGALTNTYDAAGKVRGLYYQFGRKDPIAAGQNWGTSVIRYNASGALIPYSPVSMPTPATILRPLQAIPASINNPTNFYNRGSNDWAFSVENKYLWNSEKGNKTALDPCPEGWRVPIQTQVSSTGSPWRGLTVAEFTTSGQTNGRYSPALGYYPFSGALSTSMTNVGVSGNFWSSWPGTSNISTGLSITAASIVDAPAIDQSQGLPIRCVVDINYLKNTGGGLFKNSNVVNKLLP